LCVWEMRVWNRYVSRFDL